VHTVEPIGATTTETTTTLGRWANNRAWRTYLLVGLALTAWYLFDDDQTARAAIIVVLYIAAAAAVAVQLRRSGASDRAAWVATGAMMLLWAFAWVFWEKQILDSGAPPAINSWINFVFLAGYPGLLATLAILLWRRERDVVCFVDVGIVAAALFMIVWTVLLRRYADIDLVPLGGRVVQIGYATFDIAVLAVVVRLLIAPWRRSPAFAFLPVAGLAILFSDVIWNWSTQLGTYSPGSWADGGWLLAPAAVGAAALHRSATDLFQPAEVTARGLRRDRLAVLMSAALVGPVLLGVRLFDNSLGPSELWVIAVGMAVVVVLVLARLALTLREKESLASQLATQNRQLLELDRLKDDFVASVSHELRTPLTSIRGYLDLVREGEGGELNEDQQRFLGIVDRNADRLLRVVSDLLFVAQVGAGKLDLALEEVDVAEVVDHAADAARPHAESKELGLVAEIESMPTVLADRARLGQVVDNLVSNAVKFTPAGGRVSVRAFAANGAAVLEVSDTGLGMSSEEQEQLFQRFYRTAAATENAIQGTGLGLTILKAIVDAHGGTVAVTSAEGAGTTFRVELPVADGARA